MEIRIADLGLAGVIEKQKKLFTKCGTPGYIAPEVLKGLGYDMKADIFSAGVIMFNLFTKRSLFSGQNQKELIRNNHNMDYSKSKSTIIKLPLVAQ